MIAAVIMIIDGARSVILAILAAARTAPADARGELQHVADELYTLRSRLEGIAA